MPPSCDIACRHCEWSGEQLIYDFGSDEEGNGVKASSDESSSEDEDEDEEDESDDQRERRRARRRAFRQKIEQRKESFTETARTRRKLSRDERLDKQVSIIARLEGRDIRRLRRYESLRNRHIEQRRRLKRRVAVRNERIEERDQRITEHESSVRRLEDAVRSRAQQVERRNTQLGMLAEINDLQRLRITSLEEQLAARPGQTATATPRERSSRPPTFSWPSSLSSNASLGKLAPTDGESTQNNASTNKQPATKADVIPTAKVPRPTPRIPLSKPNIPRPTLQVPLPTESRNLQNQTIQTQSTVERHSMRARPRGSIADIALGRRRWL
ncbi:uncharacterized protein BKA78DRAFT_296727 [Phyllosticta capitalensis]|uniref:Uncharacterized protein n=1 Tax=Phyllosticta capitalensis TaxID=121624 RepID=A0ABR1YLL8_9PEZI